MRRMPALMVAIPKFINNPGRVFRIFRQVSSWRRDTASSGRAPMATDMDATAVALAGAGIRTRFGDLTGPEMRQQLRPLHGA
jgi:hypothetical protein